MGKRTGVVAFPRAGERFELAENATMRLPRGRSATVMRVERGTVLVTQEGDLEDHVLRRGDEIILPSGGLAAAWAFTDAAVCVRTRAVEAQLDDDAPAGAAA